MITESMNIIILSAVTALGLAVLAAAAYAFSNETPSERQIHGGQALTTTTVAKNQTWPLIGDMTARPCAANRCEDV